MSTSENVFFQWLVSWLDNWAEHSSLRNIIKFIVHQLTGKCELQRICELGSTGPREMRIMENALYHSKFPEIRRLVVAEDTKVKSALEIILRKKRIFPDESNNFMEIMPHFLSKLLSYNKLVAKVNGIRSQAYNEENEGHEEMLEKLWKLLKPGTEIESRYTDQWGEIGFQGKNPATDFRGMGILTLKLLIFFLENATEDAQRVFGFSLHPRFGFPFAVAGINLTGAAFDLLQSGKLKAYFYESDTTFYNLTHFQEIFVKLFCGFSQFYVSSEPESIMEFNVLLNKYKEIVGSRLERETKTNESNVDIFKVLP